MADRRLSRKPKALDVPEPRDLLGQVAKVALAAAFRASQPKLGERFEKAPDQPLLRRLYYRADDGWQAPLFRLEAPAGTSGEPVILAHGLGVNRYSLDYASGLSLARAIRAAGFEVFLLEHRGDRSALRPPRARPFDVDDIATRDVPAAIDAVRHDTGFERVLFVGHALGGQLLYAHMAHARGDDLAAAVTLCAAVRFDGPSTTARSVPVVRALLPRRWHLPMRLAATLAAPRMPSIGHVPGELARGLLLHGTEDLGLGVARQVLLWLETGTLCDRDDRLDYLEALAGVPTPTLVLAGAQDSICPPEHALPVLDYLPGELQILPGGHLDPLLGQAREQAWPRVVSWLEKHRRACW